MNMLKQIHPYGGLRADLEAVNTPGTESAWNHGIDETAQPPANGAGLSV